MTKEEIIKMEAGDELDKLVAEEIFQRVVKSWETFRGKPIYQMQLPSDYGEVYEHLLPFSTDISAAWQVVEKMEELAWAIIINPAKFTHSWEYMVGYKHKHSGKFTSVIAHSLKEISMTICKAALLAKLAR